MEYIEDTQYLVQGALPNVPSLDYCGIYSNDEGYEYFVEVGIIQITIHFLQCMLTFQNIKSKR